MSGNSAGIYSWGGDICSFPYASYSSFFRRGADILSLTHGVFAFNGLDGDVDINYGFRTCLIVSNS